LALALLPRTDSASPSVTSSVAAALSAMFCTVQFSKPARRALRGPERRNPRRQPLKVSPHIARHRCTPALADGHNAPAIAKGASGACVQYPHSAANPARRTHAARLATQPGRSAIPADRTLLGLEAAGRGGLRTRA
jgi:hypothetical protein